MAAGLALFVIALLRTAWVSDDAYISFRSVANFVDGAGLRWNATERVQAFTHPLWLFVVSLPYAITREPYYTSIAVSILFSVTAAALLCFRIASTPARAALGITVLVFSKAFVDYSTSGLENALSHALLGVVLTGFWTADSLRAHRTAALAAGLLVVNRADLALLVAPIVLFPLRGGALSFPRRLLWFASPAAAWAVFSLIYFGVPVPNTAFAKLATGISRSESLAQGWHYFGDSFERDPLTLVILTAGVGVGAVAPAARRAGAGIVLYLAYVLWIGGDFMSGRFFSAPLYVATAATVRYVPVSGRLAWVPAAAVLAGGLLAPSPPILSDGYYSVPDVPPHGIADERGVYYQTTGLLRRRREWQPPKVELYERYRFAVERGRRAITSDHIGMQGYLAGRSIHIIDLLALADPLLARLPAERPWRVGHYPRTLPAGYFDSVNEDRNRIVDPDLAKYYDQLRLLTREPIWSIRRFEAIVAMNVGRFEPLIAAYVSRSRAAVTAK